MQVVQKIVAEHPQGVLTAEIVARTNFSTRYVTRLLIALRNRDQVFGKMIDPIRRIHLWTPHYVPRTDEYQPLYPDFDVEHRAWCEQIRAKKPSYNPWGQR